MFGPSGREQYTTLAHWLWIQPCKAYFLTFYQQVNAHVKEVVTSRHLPAIFDEYIEIINKYGLIFPVSKTMKQQMPFAFRLSQVL